MSLHKIKSSLYALAFAIVWLLIASSVQAHENLTTKVDILENENKSLAVTVNLSLEAALVSFGPEESGDSHSAEFSRLSALSADQLALEFEPVKAEVMAGLTLLDNNDAPVRLSLISAQIPEPPTDGSDRQTVLRYVTDPLLGGEMIRTHWGLPIGALIVRADAHDGTELISAYLQPDEITDPFSFSNGSALSQWSVAKDYLVVGFRHIIPDGWDHILFIVGLFLFSAAWRPLLTQVSVFTLAHSLTLALALTGRVNLAPSFIEPLIALSIVFIAVENIRIKQLQSGRLLVIFLFGLLHGLGFAGSIGEIGFSGATFFTALLSFNVGIELGQLAVIALCMVTVGLWFSTRAWYFLRVQVPASIMIGMVGSFWFVERLTT